jgi:hypothetical protein
MNRHRLLVLIFAIAVFAVAAYADGTQSYTGTLLSPDNATSTFDSTDSFLLTLNLATASDVTLQTYGFGGGANAMGTMILPGGTDPFVGLFSGTGNSALFINGTSATQTNYTPGCLPANTEAIGGSPQCGDVTLTFDDLAAGMYTVLLSDGQYVPCAADSTGCATLGDGAFDFTGGFPGGSFCNADFNGVACPNTSGAWALDVTETPATPTPEPASLALLGTGLLAVAGVLKRGNQLKRRKP